MVSAFVYASHPHNKKAGLMLLFPLFVALALPIVVGQATRSHAVYRYTTPLSGCVRIYKQTSIVAMP